MVRNLKALMYSGSIDGANFASFVGLWGELHEICMICWKFAENKTLKNLKIKPYYIFRRKIKTFCREASLPFPGEWTGVVA